MSSKTRRYCAAGGCQADKRKRTHIYLSWGWYFNTVVIELNRSSPLIHYLVISPVIDWNYLQVQLLGKFTQSYDLNYKKTHPVRAGTV